MHITKNLVKFVPANWEEGKDAMKGNRDGVADYLAKH